MTCLLSETENDECHEKGERRIMIDHQQVCQFRRIDCEFCHQSLATCKYEVCFH